MNLDKHIQKIAESVNRENFILQKLKLLLASEARMKLCMNKSKYFHNLQKLLSLHKNALNDFALKEISEVLQFMTDVKKGMELPKESPI